MSDFIGPTSDLDDATPWTENPAAEDAANEPDAMERLRLLGRRAARQVEREAVERAYAAAYNDWHAQTSEQVVEVAREMGLTEQRPPMRREALTLRGPR